ncbi:hypothetical protein Rsub_02449 [Raphidocelis subcapitata]|uniref:Uncharacterized protein n=1 Tax=Raphidocelis subcapitata TaxID=307507 RepID=A0A2V0NXP9_9CHLO|nr:hypothetical protein Rsub_02449 [Raphidocelis subcapitata]|eukprot:GBF90343.1 hypothetical protein Rsub_02449 [Raphidocelis subcapitata]
MRHMALALITRAAAVFCALGLLLATAAGQPQLAPGGAVGVFYYSWYATEAADGRWIHWDHGVLPHWDAARADQWPSGPGHFHPPETIHSPFYPQLGPYSSKSPQVIQTHIKQILDAGAGFVVASWWGPKWRKGMTEQNMYVDEAISVLVKELERQPKRQDGAYLKLAFHLEPYQGRTVESVREDLAELNERFGASPALLRAGGRPVFFVYESGRIRSNVWAKLFQPWGDSTVRGTKLDGVFLGVIMTEQDVDTEITGGGFDGSYTYFACESTSEAAEPSNWGALAAKARRGGKLFIPSVGPGYDDRRIRPWNSASTRPREGGARYTRNWEAARAAKPDAVTITSWNEVAEGTQIEPSVPYTDPRTGQPYQDFGPNGPSTYVDLTRAQSGAFKRELSARRAAAAQERAPAAAGGGWR